MAATPGAGGGGAASSTTLSLAKRLAHSSNKGIRDAAMSTVETWLTTHEDPPMEDYMKLWKSLFYCVWYSDKVPVQQELVFRLARLVRRVTNLPARFRFLAAFFDTMSREWLGIDHLRVDKFHSLVRRFVHEVVVTVVAHRFEPDVLAAYVTLAYNHMLGDDVPSGVCFHVADVLLDEIGAAQPSITTNRLQSLLVPVYAVAIRCKDRYMFDRVYGEVLQPLLIRISEHGLKAAGPEEEAVTSPITHTLHHTVNSEVMARHVVAADCGTTLLVDGHERMAALKKAFRQVNLVPLGRDIFAIAAHAATQGSHRGRLYSLHRDFIAAAVRLKHAKTEEDLMPSTATEVTPAVQEALLLLKWKPTPTKAPTSPSAPAPAAAVGTKRKREGAAPSPAPAARTHGKAATMAAGGAGHDALAEEDDMVDPPSGAKVGVAKASGLKGSASGPAKHGRGAAAPSASAKRRRSDTATTAAVVDDDGDGDDALAALAAIPTVGELKAHDGHMKAVKHAATARGATVAVPPAPAVNSQGQAVKGILKKVQASTAGGLGPKAGAGATGKRVKPA